MNPFNEVATFPFHNATLGYRHFPKLDKFQQRVELHLHLPAVLISECPCRIFELIDIIDNG
jgi:hypothetical protein